MHAMRAKGRVILRPHGTIEPDGAGERFKSSRGQGLDRFNQLDKLIPMSQLTKKDIEQVSDAVVERLFTVVATKDDVAQVKDEVVQVKAEVTAVEDRLTNKIAAAEEGLTGKFSNLQASVDRYLKRTESWHDEFRVLKARHDRLIHILDQKGIVREEETHLA